MSDATAVRSLQLELLPTQSDFAAGSIPDFAVRIRNSGSSAARVCIYMLDYRLKAAMVANSHQGKSDFELQPFRPVTWLPIILGDVIELAPGAHHEHLLKLNGDDVFGFIQRHSQLPAVPSSWIVKGFPAGQFTFQTALSEQMGIYVGQTGFFDRKLEARKVPRDLPGGEAYSDCFMPFIKGTATLRFA